MVFATGITVTCQSFWAGTKDDVVWLAPFLTNNVSKLSRMNNTAIYVSVCVAPWLHVSTEEIGWLTASTMKPWCMDPMEPGTDDVGDVHSIFRQQDRCCLAHFFFCTGKNMASNWTPSHELFQMNPVCFQRIWNLKKKKKKTQRAQKKKPKPWIFLTFYAHLNSCPIPMLYMSTMY